MRKSCKNLFFLCLKFKFDANCSSPLFEIKKYFLLQWVSLGSMPFSLNVGDKWKVTDSETVSKTSLRTQKQWERKKL